MTAQYFKTDHQHKKVRPKNDKRIRKYINQIDQFLILPNHYPTTHFILKSFFTYGITGNLHFILSSADSIIPAKMLSFQPDHSEFAANSSDPILDSYQKCSDLPADRHNDAILLSITDSIIHSIAENINPLVSVKPQTSGKQKHDTEHTDSARKLKR